MTTPREPLSNARSFALLVLAAVGYWWLVYGVVQYLSTTLLRWLFIGVLATSVDAWYWEVLPTAALAWWMVAAASLGRRFFHGAKAQGYWIALGLFQLLLHWFAQGFFVAQNREETAYLVQLAVSSAVLLLSYFWGPVKAMLQKKLAA